MTINIWFRWSCPECGAPAGDDCDEQCPSGLAVLAEQIEAFLDEPPCHPNEVAAAADLCFCQGTAGRAVA